MIWSFLFSFPRNNGITQCELAKEFDIKGNNFFYQVRNLESQQLIVRKSSTVWEKEAGSEAENGPKSNPNPINTNLIHLYRYAKSVSLKPQQKFEIRRSIYAGPDISENIENADKRSGSADVSQGECLKEDVLVKDYLPAMQAVCDKLEQANEKILVVKDIKVALNYRKTQGHRSWASIVKKLEDAGFVEKLEAEVNGRGGKCLRLLKRFDRHYFQSKQIASAYDGFDSGNLPMHGKRGQVTYQFLELPMEHRIYDMVDDEGSKGITLHEVCERLGLSSKKMYKRIAGMCSRFGMRMESEKPDRTQFYRVWTPRSYKQYSNNVSSGNCQQAFIRNGVFIRSGDMIPHDQSAPKLQLVDSSFQDTDLHCQQQSTDSAHNDFEQCYSCDKLAADTQITVHHMVPQNSTNESLISDSDARVNTTDTAIVAPESSLSVPLENPPSVSTTTSKQTQWHRSVALTMLGVGRIQWILTRLEVDKFVISVELYQQLKDLEKDRSAVMDRKTLHRTLNELQQNGLCKVIQVSIPTVKNFNRERKLGVILHPSIDVTSDLHNQIYERLREFENQSRSPESGKSMDRPVTVSTGVERTSDHGEEKPEVLVAMRENGFVQAKMIRAKLLHNFLWDYTCSLPGWQNASPSTKDDHNLKSCINTCPFTMHAATKAMPLELFLQIVGSAKVIDNMVQKCRVGLRLMDLLVEEYKLLLDTNATARLSCIVNILLRLKLIQLVWQGRSDMDIQPHASSKLSMELEPYIEEPLPRVPPSLKTNSLDPRPRIRHDFVFSKKEDVNEYWDTLEYCYTSADLASALRSFPGSVVHELFRYRSWTSVRGTTADQSMELLRHMEFDDVEKIPFKKCVKIARELNLTVEQVLRVSYNKHQRRVQRSFNASKSKEQVKCMLDNSEPLVKKRRTSKDRSDEHVPDAATGVTSCRATMHGTRCADGNNMNKDPSVVSNDEFHDDAMKMCGDHSHDDYAIEPEPHAEDQSLYFIKRTPNCIQRRMIWTDELDRQIVIQYARYRAIMGERCNRVAWSLVPNLPTYPNACRRRMNRLNSDKSTRTAVMRLCNLLAERYSRSLNNPCGTHGNRTFNFGDSAMSSQGSAVAGTADGNMVGIPDDTQPTFLQECWDDFETSDCKMAIDDVLRCKRMAKLEPIRGIGSLHRQSWPDGPSNEGTKLDLQKDVTSREESFVLSSGGNRNNRYVETGNKNNNAFPTATQNSLISHPTHGKVAKLLSSRGIEIWRQVRKSTTIANVLELLKLFFLSNPTASEVQTSLERTLQLYDKRDIITAFSYLKERGFVDFQNQNNQAILSQKFWNNVYSSPFPDNSGKRAARFSSWLCKQDENLNDGVDLMTDIQCGEIFNLFALISTGEFFVSPILPKEGIGEASEFKGSPSFLIIDDEMNYLKRRGDEAGLPCSGGKNKKQKIQGKVDSSDFCSRREKGFPGIKLCINRATSAQHDAQWLTNGEINTCLLTNREKNSLEYADMKVISIPPSLNGLGLSDDSGSQNQSEVALGELLYDQMKKYAEQVASALVCSEASTFCPELFRSVHSVLERAGEQGLNIEDICSVIGIQEVQLAEVAVDTLEAFQLAFKEDIIREMDVLNPQSCRQLLETMVLDNHLTTRLMHQTAYAAPPSILHNLFHCEVRESKSEFRKHYFANSTSTSLL